MKKPVIFILIASIFLAGIWFVNSYHVRNYPPMGPDNIYYPDLFVGNFPIEDSHISLYDVDEINILILPLTKLLEGLDVPVTWVDPYTANFSIKDQQYTLSLQDSSICRTGETKNLIIHGNGIFAIHCRVYEDSQELYVDNYSSVATLTKMGLPISIHWDSTQNSVFVTEGEGYGNLTQIYGTGGDTVPTDPAQLNP